MIDPIYWAVNRFPAPILATQGVTEVTAFAHTQHVMVC